MVISSKRIRWPGHVALKDEIKNAFNIIARKPQGKRSFWRPKYRSEENIKVGF
jgi:hypothetical protein